MSWQKPICAKCKKPVQEFVIQERMDMLSRTYTAFCHGAKETVECTEEQMFWIVSGAHHIVEFVAFREKKEIGNERAKDSNN